MRRRYALLSGLFCISGAAALMLQVLWTRRLTTVFGSTTEAAAVVIAVFFSGLAMGNGIVTLRARQWKRPLLAYAIAEGIVAVCVPLAWLLPAASESLLGVIERLVLATAVVGLPAIAMGATLPALGESVGRDPDAPAWRVTQWLYAANTAGGALGAALAGMVLPMWLGIRGSELLAMGMLVAVAGTSVLLARVVGDQPPPVGTTYRRRAPAGMLWLAAGSGGCVMALEVLWTRLFSMVLHNSVYTFAAIVVVVLIALSLGSALAARIADPWNAVVLGAAFAGVGVVAGMCTFMAMTSLDVFGQRLGFGAYVAAALGFIGLIAGLPAVAAGLIFPSLWRAAREREDGRMGALTGVNTAGAVVGALLAGFVILPWLGVWEGLFIVACVYLAIAVAAARRAGEWTRTIAYAIGGILVAINIAWIPMTARTEFVAGATMPWRYHPAAYPVQRLHRGDRLLHVDETRMGTVAVVEGAERGRRLVLDNLYVLGGTRSREQERRLGHVPLLLHPAPQRVGFIGIATGISLSAVSVAPEVKEAVAIEIIPEVAAAAEAYFVEHNKGVLRDPRVRIVHADGRVWLAAEDERKFDVIVSDLFVPWHAGTGVLYAREHFVEVRESLSADGLFALWLPLWQLGPEEFRSIAATFLDVFETTEVWRANFVFGAPIVGLVGWHGRPRYDDASIRERLARTEGDLLLADLDTFGMLHVGTLEPRHVEGAPRNTQDYPVVEFLAPRSHKSLDLLVRERWLAVSALFRDLAEPQNAWDRRQEAGHRLHRAIGGDAAAFREASQLAPDSAYLKRANAGPSPEEP